jgi:hypothetical protein
VRSISGFFGASAPAFWRASAAGLDLVGLGRSRLAVGAHDVDALLVQVLREAPDLLLGDLDLLEGGRDLLEGQEPALLTVGDELTQVVHLPDGCLVSE